MSLHRVQARRRVRLAQIAALGMAGLAGLLVAMPAPSGASDPVAKVEPTPAANAVPDEAKSVDYSVAANVLGSRVARVESPAAKTDAKASDEPPPLPPPIDEPIEEGPHFRFAGTVRSPRKDFALIIDHEGKEKLVGQGEYIGDHLVLGISSEKLVLADCDDNRMELLIETRPDVAPTDSTLSLSNTQEQVNPSAMGRNGEMIHMPGNPTSPDEIAERYRKIEEMRRDEEKRREMERSGVKNGVQPPARPTPGTTGRPASKPSTPTPNRTGAAKPDVK